MKILYLSDEVNSPINRNLCKAISNASQDVSITLLCVNVRGVKIKDEIISNERLKEINIKSNYNYNYQRLNFFYKRKHKLHLIESVINVRDYDLIYASTLFSDGAVAREILRKYGIPYIVSVRGTDINLYLKKIIHLWYLGKQIVNNAKSVICISESLKYNLINSIAYKLFSYNSTNLHVVANGIDDYWIDNKRKMISEKMINKFLYIGHLDKNKNVKKMICSFLEARKINDAIHLTIVGSGGEYEEFVKRISTLNSGISYLGPIYDRAKLIDVVRANDAFIMVSHSETFGLVYLEVMSQGLPVIYSKGQGIDKSFRDKIIGEAVNSQKSTAIKNSIINLSTNKNRYDNIYDIIEEYRWSNIGNLVMNIIYKS